MKKLIAFLKEEDGVTSIEYGLIAALLAVGIIAAVTAAGGAVSGIFNNAATTMNGAL